MMVIPYYYSIICVHAVVLMLPLIIVTIMSSYKINTRQVLAWHISILRDKPRGTKFPLLKITKVYYTSGLASNQAGIIVQGGEPGLRLLLAQWVPRGPISF